MFATIGALITGTAYECAEDAKGLSANPVQDCLRPILNQMTAFIYSVGMSTMNEAVGNAVVANDNDLADLWYCGHDFDRFKRELIVEARTAGYFSPETQYAHIKSKYMDETTRTNTFQNLKRSSSSGDVDNVALGDADGHPSATLTPNHYGQCRASVSADSALCRPTPQRPSKGGSGHTGSPSTRATKHRGHARSVSFDLNYRRGGTPLAQAPRLTTRVVPGPT